MRTLGNILWHFPFFGFALAIMTWLVGVLLLITVVGAPIGRGLMECGRFLFSPFSRAMVKRSQLSEKSNMVWKVLSIVVTIIYFPLGIVLAVINIIQIAGLFISITGIPVAIVLSKSLGTFFNPANKKCVPRAVKEELDRREARAEIDRHLPDLPKRVVHQTTSGSAMSGVVVDFKKCPFCGEEIRFVAIKCRYCGSGVEVPELPLQISIRNLKSENASVREQAVIALGEMGRDARPALEHLEQLKKDSKKSIRIRVAWAIGEILRGT